MARGDVRRPMGGQLLPFLLIAALLFGCAKKGILQEGSPPVPYPPPPAPEAPQSRKEPIPERAREPVAEPVPEKDPFEAVPRKYRLKALEGEKNREWGKALLAWKVVYAFAPGDPQARSKMESLNARMTGEADKHFRRGVELLARNAKQPAGRELAAALVYQPDHKGALEYLGRIFTEPDSFEYRTVEGDTVAEIARKIYSRAELGFLIAYFNDLDAGKTVRPGMTVKAPVVRPELLSRTPPREVERKPSAPGKPGTPGKPERITGSSPGEAETHYQKGVKYFLSDDLEKAIQEWEITIRLDPDHPKANRDLNKAKTMKEKLDGHRK